MHSEPIKACVFYMSPVGENPQFHDLECVFSVLLEKEEANTQSRVRFLVCTGAAPVAGRVSYNYQLLLIWHFGSFLPLCTEPSLLTTGYLWRESEAAWSWFFTFSIFTPFVSRRHHLSSPVICLDHKFWSRRVGTFWLSFCSGQRKGPFSFTACCKQPQKIRVPFSWHSESYRPDLPSLEMSAAVLRLRHRHTVPEVFLLLDIRHLGPITTG